jgi:flavodoxin
VTRQSVLRAVLLGGAAAAAGVAVGACTGSAPADSADQSGDIDPMPSTTTRSTGNKVLLAYFSRAGENYYYEGRRTLEIGNTEVVASIISRLIPCDVYRIEAADPYSDDYDDTVARNVREQDADARPAIAQPLPALEQYEAVLLGSPIWNVRAPMIMSTFVEGVDLGGKTIWPFTTYAMSGLGTVVRDYGRSAPDATIGDGLAVQGEEVDGAAGAIEQWLRAAGLVAD